MKQLGEPVFPLDPSPQLAGCSKSSVCDLITESKSCLSVLESFGSKPGEGFGPLLTFGFLPAFDFSGGSMADSALCTERMFSTSCQAQRKDKQKTNTI